jgi:indole-3-glycerol phosphate synthase
VSAPAKTSTILDRIVDTRLASLARGRQRVPEPVLRMTVRKAARPRNFAAPLCADRINVIAELKKASPSLGIIRETFHPAELAARLAASGAAALSVLTEEEFFQGSLGYLRSARKAAPVPVLRKDFIVDPWQVWEARAADADAFLLIVAILQDRQLRALISLGRELCMSALVEVHTREELQRAVDAGAQIIGVNNRDLRTFEVRLDTSFELIEHIPDDCIAVSESGIRAHQDLLNLRAAGFDAFLIGERLMQAADPAAALRELLGEKPGAVASG